MKTSYIDGKTPVDYDEEKAYLDERGIPFCRTCNSQLYDIVQFGRLAPPMAFRFKCLCEQAEDKLENLRIEKVRRREVQEEIGMPSKYRFATSFDDLDSTRDERQKTVFDICKAFASTDREHLNLVLIGTIGTGKTLLAWLMALESAMTGATPIVTTEARLVDEVMSASYRGRKSQRLDEFCEAPLLIIDEVGRIKVKDGETNRGILFEIVDRRTDWRRKTVIITNLGATDFKDYVGVATVDRLIEKKMTVPVMNWSSYRSN